MPPPSTTTTASDSEARMAVGNCSPAKPESFKGRTAMSGGLPVERGEEKIGEQRAHLGGLGLAIDGGAELGTRRQTLRAPTQMLAPHAHAGLLPVVFQHRLELRPDGRAFLARQPIRQI